MKTTVIFFPFDLFGSSGTAAGVQLLADEFREMLADNKRERVPTRARAYAGKVKTHEFTFDKIADYQDWRPEGRRSVRQALDRADFLVWITGNHLGVLPLYDELSSEPGTLIVQFDAHLDIHNFADCTKELSHGNFLRHCAGPLPSLINIGHRELLLRAQDVGAFYTETFAADALAIDPTSALTKVHAAAKSAKRVFLDIDCDVFDPAFFPGAAQSVPFGLSSLLVLRFLAAAWSPRVAGLALSEFDPSRDREDRSLATLVWLLEWLLLKRHEGIGPVA